MRKKFFFLQNSLENIRNTVFCLMTFQTKFLQLNLKGIPAYALF